MQAGAMPILGSHLILGSPVVPGGRRAGPFRVGGSVAPTTLVSTRLAGPGGDERQERDCSTLRVCLV